MNSTERFFEYTKHKGLNVSQLEQECGFSKGYLQGQKSRGSEMGISKFAEIKKHCTDLNLDWIVTGMGTMTELEPSGLKKELRDLQAYVKEVEASNERREDLLNEAIEKLKARRSEIEKMANKNAEFEALLKEQKKEG